MFRRLINSLQFQEYVVLATLFLLLTATSGIGVATANNGVRFQTYARYAQDQEAGIYAIAYASEQYFMADAGAPRQDKAHLIQDELQEFDKFRVGYRSGDKALGIVPIQNQDALALFDQIDPIWTDYKKLILDNLASPARPGSALAQSIDDKTTALSGLLAQFTQLLQDIGQKEQDYSRQLNSLLGWASTLFVVVPIF